MQERVDYTPSLGQVSVCPSVLPQKKFPVFTCTP